MNQQVDPEKVIDNLVSRVAELEKSNAMLAALIEQYQEAENQKNEEN